MGIAYGFIYIKAKNDDKALLSIAASELTCSNCGATNLIPVTQGTL